MSWVKLDDRFPEHPKVVGLSDRAFRAHVTGLIYCARYLTDGDLPLAVLPRPKVLAELVAAGLWRSNGDGDYAIHDYLEFQPSKQEVLSRRASKAVAGAKGAAKRWASVRHDGPDAPVPVPVPQEPKPLRASRRVYAYTAEFEEFWSVYAKEGKHDKPKAAAAFTRALLRADLGAILAGARRYAEDPNRDPGHTKYAEGWLNGDRWNDPVLSSKDPKADELEQARLARIADAKRLAESTRGK